MTGNSMAMGLQTATIRRAGTQGVRTTFVTEVLSAYPNNLIT